MPTGVTYHDEKTINEVYTALFGNNDLDFPQVLAAVTRLQNAGILFRKDVPEELRPTRRTKEEMRTAGEATDEGALKMPSNRIEDLNARVDQVSQGSAQTSIVE